MDPLKNAYEEAAWVFTAFRSTRRIHSNFGVAAIPTIFTRQLFKLITKARSKEPRRLQTALQDAPMVGPLSPDLRRKTMPWATRESASFDITRSATTQPDRRAYATREPARSSSRKILATDKRTVRLSRPREQSPNASQVENHLFLKESTHYVRITNLTTTLS